MNYRKLIVMAVAAGFVAATMPVSAQTCKEQFSKANELLRAKKYDQAQAAYQNVKSCSDKSYAKDCDYWINWIRNNRPAQKQQKTTVFTISTDSVVIPYQGGENQVRVYGTNSWKYIVEGDWGEVKKAGNAIIISCKDQNNSLNARTMKIRITNGSQSKVVDVVNEGSPEVLRSSVSSLTFPASGQTDVIDIEANTNWQVAQSPEWVKAQKDKDNLRFTVDANTLSTEREGDVKVETPSNQTVIIKIYQNASIDEKLSFSKNDLTFGPDGGDEYIRVYTDAPDWKFGDFPHWCQVTRIGKDSVRIHCTPNPPINELREASVNVTTGNQTLGINIAQAAKPMVMTVPDFGIGGRTISLGITAGYISPVVSASSGGNFTGSVVNYALGDQREEASYSVSGGFTVGLLADIRLYKNFYVKAGLEYTHYSYKNEFNKDVERRILQTTQYYLGGSTQNKYKEEYTFNQLDIPILASYRFSTGKISHLQLNVGPVIHYGLSAKMKLSGNTDSETLHAYRYSNLQYTNQLYNNVPYSSHYAGSGELDLYGKHFDYHEIYGMGNIADILNTYDLDSSPFKKLNFGIRVGTAFEYAGVSLGVEYNLMLTNMADKKFWESDRLTIFDQTPDVVMSGYKQRNSYLGVKLAYTFRY